MLELRIGSLRLQVGFSFLLLAAIVCRWNHGTLLLLSFLAILLHEAGHFIAMLRVGMPVKLIRFTAFGVHIVQPEMDSVPPVGHILVYLAGPAANLLLAAGGLLTGSEAGGYFGAVNLLLGLLHLLPAGNLDGACALREGLELFFSERWARALAEAVSLTVLVALMPVLWQTAGIISPTAMLLWCYLLLATLREY